MSCIGLFCLSTSTLSPPISVDSRFLEALTFYDPVGLESSESSPSTDPMKEAITETPVWMEGPVPQRFWQNEQNRRSYFHWLAQRLQFKRFEDFHRSLPSLLIVNLCDIYLFIYCDFSDL